MFRYPSFGSLLVLDFAKESFGFSWTHHNIYRLRCRWHLSSKHWCFRSWYCRCLFLASYPLLGYLHFKSVNFAFYRSFADESIPLEASYCLTACYLKKPAVIHLRYCSLHTGFRISWTCCVMFERTTESSEKACKLWQQLVYAKWFSLTCNHTGFSSQESCMNYFASNLVRSSVPQRNIMISLEHIARRIRPILSQVSPDSSFCFSSH